MRDSAPLDAGLQGPPSGWGCPQRWRQLLDWRPSHWVLEDSGSDGCSPREKEKGRELEWSMPAIPAVGRVDLSGRQSLKNMQTL